MWGAHPTERLLLHSQPCWFGSITHSSYLASAGHRIFHNENLYAQGVSWFSVATELCSRVTLGHRCPSSHAAACNWGHASGFPLAISSENVNLGTLQKEGEQLGTCDQGGHVGGGAPQPVRRGLCAAPGLVLSPFHHVLLDSRGGSTRRLPAHHDAVCALRSWRHLERRQRSCMKKRGGDKDKTSVDKDAKTTAHPSQVLGRTNVFLWTLRFTDLFTLLLRSWRTGIGAGPRVVLFAELFSPSSSISLSICVSPKVPALVNIICTLLICLYMFIQTCMYPWKWVLLGACVLCFHEPCWEYIWCFFWSFSLSITGLGRRPPALRKPSSARRLLPRPSLAPVSQRQREVLPALG